MIAELGNPPLPFFVIPAFTGMTFKEIFTGASIFKKQKQDSVQTGP